MHVLIEFQQGCTLRNVCSIKEVSPVSILYKNSYNNFKWITEHNAHNSIALNHLQEILTHIF